MATERQLMNLGRTIDNLFDVVLNKIHDCDICGRTFLPEGHPHCVSCESPLMLIQCADCQGWYCKAGCSRMHVCGPGPQPFQGRF